MNTSNTAPTISHDLGYAFLKAVRKAWIWERDGIRALIPIEIYRRLKFFRTVGTLVNYDGGESRYAAIKENIFGDRKLSSEATAPAEFSTLYVCLSKYQVFKSTLFLPKSARYRLGNAIELRIEDISPVPLENAVYNWRVIGTGQSSIEVEVAIVKTDHIVNAIKRYAPLRAKSITLVSGVDSCGEIEFTFITNKSKEKDKRFSKILPYLSFVISGLILLGALGLRASNVSDMHDDFFPILVERIHLADSVARKLELAIPAIRANAKNMTLAELLLEFDAMAKAAPASMRVLTLQSNGGVTTAEAYSPVADVKKLQVSHGWTINSQEASPERPGFVLLNVTYNSGRARIDF